jgi:hypothetical protein
MQATKTLKERERELQALLATREGKAQLEALADHYYASGGPARPPRAPPSSLTFSSTSASGGSLWADRLWPCPAASLSCRDRLPCSTIDYSCSLDYGSTGTIHREKWSKPTPS